MVFLSHCWNLLLTLLHALRPVLSPGSPCTISPCIVPSRTVIPPAQQHPEVIPSLSSRPKTHSCGALRGERQSIHSPREHRASRPSPPNIISTSTPLHSSSPFQPATTSKPGS
ncbi:hypothetical protein ILYODFUR_027269 [Ilyodon furcidens]|uniref:Secreted protein n=1 Tax=Ilyodon furcidens TaxID=33524 RepID=A0ABV0T2V0_9TELE